jgi:hypothetical protein
MPPPPVEGVLRALVVDAEDTAELIYTRLPVPPSTYLTTLGVYTLVSAQAAPLVTYLVHLLQG